MICTGFVFWFWVVLLILVLCASCPNTIVCTTVDNANPLGYYTLPMNLKTLSGRETGQVYLDEVLPF